MKVPRWWLRCVCMVVAVVLCGIATMGPAKAENANVIIGVGDTTTLFTGTTSPGALVTIMEGGAVLGATTALLDGTYSSVLTNQTPGIHSYQIGAQDTSGRYTDTITAVANVQEHAQTTIATFLPSTIELSTNQLSPVDTLTIKGATAPNANVVIYIDNSNYHTTTSDSGGEWQYAISGTSLPAGTHYLHVVASKIGPGQSHPSEPRNFIILKPEAPSPSPTPSPSTPTTPSPGSSSAGSGGTRPQPPVITSPHSNQVVGANTVDVSGTSQPGMQIEVWNRGQVVGSVFADAAGRWRLSITVKDFINELKARACLGRLCSDFSASVQFFYQAPATGTGPEIKLDRYRWQTFINEGINITATIRGGDTPYRLVVEWGDGRIDRYTTVGPQLLLSHGYQRAGVYNAKATVTDEQGRVAIAYFSVEVNAQRAGLSWLALLFRIAALLVGLICIAWLIRRWWRGSRRSREN